MFVLSVHVCSVHVCSHTQVYDYDIMTLQTFTNVMNIIACAYHDA